MTTPTPEAIEAAARAIWHADPFNDNDPWEAMLPDDCDKHDPIMYATVALTAAAPLLAAQAKAEAWSEGFHAGWAEAKDPGAFVNDVWDSKTPNPHNTPTIEGKSE